MSQIKTAPLEKSCIWVTGATSGIGRELVIALASAGNFVIASGRNKEALCQLSLELGSRVMPLVFDVSDTNDLAATAAKLNEITDYLDCVIAAAGICEYEDDLTFDPFMYERVFNTNFLGVIRTLHLAKPLLDRSKQKPQFVAIGSLSSVLPFPRAEAYGAAKAALEYFVKCARLDLSHQRLDISLVRPGFVATPLVQANDFSMPFLLTPKYAASRIIKGVKQRKAIIDFPRRFSWILRFFGVFEWFWLRVIGPKLSRAK
jgi:NAD(P)-dependent dehydrogenase (short-subunit alcohol dehydrogenase family)